MLNTRERERLVILVRMTMVGGMCSKCVCLSVLSGLIREPRRYLKRRVCVRASVLVRTYTIMVTISGSIKKHTYVRISDLARADVAFSRVGRKVLVLACVVLSGTRDDRLTA